MRSRRSSSELVGTLLLILGIYTRWACIYTMPLTIGAAQFWLMRNGFYFTAGGCELPVVWTLMLIVQAMLGDGPYSVKMPALPWDPSGQLQAA